eukprot:scaffold59998_cov42-Phaeocystis_antarctica.AAC.2
MHLYIIYLLGASAQLELLDMWAHTRAELATQIGARPNRPSPQPQPQPSPSPNPNPDPNPHPNPNPN